jgi:CPA1 family monovalent cation:H+ antiporter
MSYGNAFLFFVVLLFISFLLKPFIKKTPVPFCLILVLLGFVSSEFTTKILNIDTGIRWDNFKAIIFYGFLPILVFQSAVTINIKTLIKTSVLILIMVLPLTILSIAITAIGLYKGINHAEGFPWIAALISGALLSATDPEPILSTLKKHKISERIRIILQGESLFNDATAIVLFSIFIAIATGKQEVSNISVFFMRFLLVLLGGAFVGLVIGFITYWITKLIKNKVLYALICLVSAYLSFFLAEYHLSISGVISVLSCGIIFHYLSYKHNPEDLDKVHLWRFSVSIAESMIFLLAGVSITLSLFIDQWLAIIIGIAAISISRVVMIFSAFPLIAYIPGVESFSFKEQSVLVWGGVRGTVTLALALSLPLTLTYWYTIQAIAFGVVIFTLFIQTMTLPLIIKNRS